MKKAQILSAIALAFALGLTVVAPVANVNAFTVEDIEKNVKGSASEAEVAAAVKAVSATYPVYNNLLTLSDLLEKIGTVTSGSTKYDLKVTTSGATTTLDVVDDIVSAVSDSAIKNSKGNAIDTSKLYVDGNKTFTYVEVIENAVTAAKTANNYTIYESIYNAIEDKNDVNLRKAIAAYNEAYNENVDRDTNVTVDNFNTDTITNYDKYEAVIEAVAAANEAKDNYTTYFTGLSNALKANDVMTAAGRTALAGALAATNPTIASLVTLTETASNLNANYDKWVGATNSVKVAVEAADSGKTDFATENNYKLVLDIAKALKVAVPTPDKTAAEIAQTLVGYVAPVVDPTESTITNSDNTVSIKGELQDGLVVKAVKAEEKDEMFKKAFGDKKFFVYDIQVLDKNGNNVNTFDKAVTVTVKVPEGIDGAKAGIYFVNNEGKAEKIASTYNKDANTLTFTTTHFSFYAIVEDGGINAGNDGIIAAADGTASSTVAIVAGIATALTAAGAGVVAYRNARRAKEA